MAVKITRFEAENVKRIKAVQITPAENGLTVIGGRNNQGKTSALDAIIWALGGEKFRPTNAARDGSVVPPVIKLTLSNGIRVERSGKNSALKVTDTNGQKAGQQLLNSFVEQFALDMPRFMQATGKEKADTLLRIIGVEEELRALDAQEKELYTERLGVGRVADQKQKYVKGLICFPDTPDEEVSVSALIKEQQDILARNGEKQRKRELSATLTRQKELESQRVEDLRRQLQEAETRYKTTCENCEAARKDALDLYDESTAELEESIRSAEEINKRVRANQEFRRAAAEAKAYSGQYEELNEKIEAVRGQKRALLENANLPLPGLSVENGELVYQGKAWDCMSGSDQLKVSAAIVRALKPECGFLLMDKLEQMDTETLREFGAWMEEQGLQGIATRVSSSDSDCTILIEDGYVKGADAAPTEPPRTQWKAGEF